MQPKLVPDPFLILLNKTKQPLHERNYFKNKVFRKKIIKKPWKSWVCLFLLSPVPFNRQDCEKLKGPGRSYQSLFGLQNKFKKIPLLLHFLVFLWCITSPSMMMQSKAVFELFKKLHLLIYISQCMASYIIHLCFWIWKAWLVREKLQKVEYLQNEKSI